MSSDKHLRVKISFTLVLLCISIINSLDFVSEKERVKLEEGEEFIVSCSARSEYHYCKFTSPVGEKCDFFKNSANGRIMEQFCDDLKDRTVFSGSLKDHECALLIDGAMKKDEGLWSCEIGTIEVRRGQRSVSPWTLVGDINIEVKRKSSSEKNSTDRNKTTESLTGIIKANTTLLVICIVVFVLFLSILLCVVIMFGKSRLQKTSGTRLQPSRSLTGPDEAEATKDTRNYTDFTFIRKVLPHIIQFPTKE